MSGSVGKEDAQRQVDFVANVIYHGLRVTTNYSHVSLAQYAVDASVTFHLNYYSDVSNRVVLNGLSHWYYGGSTNASAALEMLRTEVFVTSNGDRPNDEVGNLPSSRCCSCCRLTAYQQCNITGSFLFCRAVSKRRCAVHR